MNQDLDIFQLVSNASVIVKAVLILLVAISLTSWIAIFRKVFQLRNIKIKNADFTREYNACRSFDSYTN